MPQGDAVNALRGRRVLVTRPSGQNRRLIDLIAAGGGEAVEIPALEILPAASLRAVQSLDLERYSDILFVSVNAVEFGLPPLRSRGDLGRQRLLAVGPATAAALRAHGLPAVQPAAAAGGEALLALPELSNWSDRRILIVRGDLGREWLRRELLNRGAQVDYLPVYRRRIADRSRPALQRALRHTSPVAVLAHSGDSVSALIELAAGHADELRESMLIAGARRIARVAGQMQWRGRIRTADSPADGDMFAALIAALAEL